MRTRWTGNAKSRRCKRHRHLSTEQLESRCLLAGDLVAHWRTDDLVTVSDDGTSVKTWNDLVSGIPAVATGSPQLVPEAVGSRSAIRFVADDGDGDEFLTVSADDSPLSNIADFSVVVAFATATTELVGGQDEWFKNTGLVDANNLGFTQDWGMSINQAGRVSAGMGRNFQQPAETVYSSQSNLNDGQVHLSAITRHSGTLALYVDDAPAVVRDDVDTAPAKLPVVFGSSVANLPYSGDIVEIRFFNGALTAEEVAATHREITAPVAVDDNYFATDGAPLTVTAEDGLLTNDVVLKAQGFDCLANHDCSARYGRGQA